MLSKFKKPLSVGLLLILFCCFSNPSYTQILSFRKINSGTRADIRNLFVDRDQNIYFLTDKIYELKEDKFIKPDFPVEDKIFDFFPVSEQDIWFSINQVNNTSRLYHFKDGKTENLRSPFVNHISAINFYSPDTALFASITDMAVYENGSFITLPPVPSQSSIELVLGRNCNNFLALGFTGDLHLYNQGKYYSLIDNETVISAAIDRSGDGYIVTQNSLYRFQHSYATKVFSDTVFKQVRCIELLADQSVLMAGAGGLILSFKEGKLTGINSGVTGILTDIKTTAYGDIWICGQQGRLLYAGTKKFPAYEESDQGFSSYKLIPYGISTDDEYGVAMTDFDGDHWPDIYAVRIFEQNRLYINNLKSFPELSVSHRFSEEIIKREATGTINPEKNAAAGELKLGVCAADVDNDGDQDLYLCYLNSINKLLLNNGRGYFRNVSEQKDRACLDMNRSNAAAFADLDLDGDLDLFVTSEEGSNRLFENNGTGSFTDITKGSGLESTGGGMCASFADVNQDGLPDLCVSFWYPSNKLYINESRAGKIIFRDNTANTGLAAAPESKSNAVAFADVNNDGFTDLFIANRNNGSRFYLNNGNGKFIDKTAEYFQPEKNLSNGAVFSDFDLDGYVDLYVTCVGSNILYKNTGGKYFTDVTTEFGAELSGYSTGCAAGDIDNDGDPDLYVANYINGNSLLFLNNTENRNFVMVRLKGVKSNKDAIGAKAWLFEQDEPAGTRKLAGYRELRAGEGYGSTNAKEMIFGINPDKNHLLLVKFPSSSDTIQLAGIKPGNTYEISEIIGFPAFRANLSGNIHRFFIDRELRPEILKFIAISLILLLYNIIQYKRSKKTAIFSWISSGIILVIFLLINQLFLFRWISAGFFVAPLITIGLLAMLHLFTGRILLRRQVHLEKLELREKLSRDLHDDLASTLGSISIYAGTLNRIENPGDVEYKKLADKINSLIKNALQSISDIIWMTSPRHDTLQSLIAKASSYMLEILIDNKIGFIPEIDIPDEPVILPEKIRNDTFLILKEALNNAIRHSGADTVFFTAKVIDKMCLISIKDNGHGILDGKSKAGRGNGLLNMRKRAEEAGIVFSVKSLVLSGETVNESGVEIILEFKI
jgi:enediyne biosynthesis protein E4